FDLLVDADMSDLAPLAAWMDEDFTGHARLNGGVRRAGSGAAYDIDATVALRALRVRDGTLAALVGSNPHLALKGSYRDRAHWRVDDAVLSQAPLRARLSADAGSGMPSGRLHLAHARHGTLNARFQAYRPAGGPPHKRYKIALDGRAQETPFAGDLVAWQTDAGLIAADAVALDWGNFSFSGQLAQQTANQIAGALGFVLHPGRSERLFGIAGDGNGLIALSYDAGGAPVLTLRASLDSLAYAPKGPPVAIAGAGEVTATALLGQAPGLTARAHLQDVNLRGNRVKTLRFDANAKGGETVFTAQADFGGLSADRLTIDGRFAASADGQALDARLTGSLGGAAVATETPLA
ncbi:MAG: hypothetical protein D6782_13215, partial [Alphaproteobacteria bacterium]